MQALFVFFSAYDLLLEEDKTWLNSKLILRLPFF